MQKLPITIEILLAILKILNFRSSFDSSFWATCLTAFYGMFQKSHLLTHNLTSLDPDKQFTKPKSDFSFYSWGLTVTVTWSKTIQFQDRIVPVPFSYIPNSPLCPVHAILHAFSFHTETGKDQAFSYVDHLILCPKLFTYQKFLVQLRHC